MGKNMKKYIYRVVILIILYLSGPLFLIVTNPQNLPIPFLMLPFLWLFLVLFITILFIERLILPTLSSRKKFIIAGIFSLVPMLLMVLQSIHQLTLKDILLVIGFVIISIFYLSRLDLVR